MFKLLVIFLIVFVKLFSLEIDLKEYKEYQVLISFIKKNDYNSFKEKLTLKNPNIYNIYSPTLLELSSKLDRIDFIKYLDQKGINLEFKTIIKKQSVAHVALDNNSYKSADYLIRRIKNINVQDINGQTLLHIAVKNSANYIIELLLSQGIDKMIKDRNGKTAYDIAIKNISIDISTLPKLNTQKVEKRSSQIIKNLEKNKIQKKLQTSKINDRLKNSKISDRLKNSKIMYSNTEQYIQKDVYIGE